MKISSYAFFFFLAVDLGIFAVLSDHILLFNYKLLHICLISESSDCSDSIYVGYMIIYICFFFHIINYATLVLQSSNTWLLFLEDIIKL